MEKPVTGTLVGIDRLAANVSRYKLPVCHRFSASAASRFQRAKKAIESGGIGKPRLSACGGRTASLAWRAGRDYRETSSSSEKQGGGVILDLCHEIDLAVALMELSRQFDCTSGHFSDLEIETEDLADIRLHHAEGRLSQQSN